MSVDSSKFVAGDSLDWTEYVALVVSLIGTIALSAWTYRTTKRDEYFVSQVPYSALVMSMIASSSSGVSLLGKPAEAYEHGAQFFFAQVVVLVGSTIMSTELFLPTLYHMDCPTIYEYFELRFHKSVRKLVTATFTLTKICHTSVLVLPPAIALNQRMSMNAGIAALTLITVFYTMLGGFKGVIWTDTLQGVIMLASMLIIGLLSIYESGDFTRFLRISYENERLSVTLPTLNPTDRFSIWIYLSFAYTTTTQCLNQANFQRMKCMTSMNDAKRAMWFQCCGMLFFGFFAVLIGISIYAYYFGCDPKEAQVVKSYTQLVVFWVTSIGSRIQGLRGIYLAGIVSASISSISCNLNSLASLLESEITFLAGPSSKRLLFQRALTILIGGAVTVISFSMKDSPSLIDLTYMSLASDGIIAGLFVLGVLIIPAETKGAFAGGVISLISFASISIFRIMSPAKKIPRFNEFMWTDRCPFNVSHNQLKETVQLQSNAPYLLQLSPFIFGPIAMLATIVIGILVSWALPSNTGKLDPRLFSELVHRFLPFAPRKAPTTLILGNV